MPDVCFYFQVHQPWRLPRYGVFDIGRSHDYFDDAANEAILQKVASRLPADERAAGGAGRDARRPLSTSAA